MYFKRNNLNLFMHKEVKDRNILFKNQIYLNKLNYFNCKKKFMILTSHLYIFSYYIIYSFKTFYHIIISFYFLNFIYDFF